MSDAILSVAEMVAAEQALMAAGASVDELMQRAGRGAADWIWRASGGRPVTVLCGPGNNGGDGYVIAEAIRERGGEVLVIAPVEPRTDAARNARSLYRGVVQQGPTGTHGAVLVDCLFGSGLARPLDEAMTSLLLGLAASHRYRVAVDVPSGVESDSGRLLNDPLPEYDLTLALGAWKFAHWLMPAAAKMGIRRLVPIGVSEGLGEARLLARPRLSVPASDAHKYRRGLLAIVGGAMPGASLLAAKAAMHGGAGYVKLLAESPPALVPSDLVVESRPLSQSLSDPRIGALLIGPGLGRDASALGKLRTALVRDVSAVLDADALMLVEPAMIAGRCAPLIATPHEGELAKLASAFDVRSEGKLALARGVARASGMVIVAKGPDTIIVAPDGSAALAPPASTWLSTAGTGDVLAGLVASRLATGAAPFEAACEGVWLHGKAARLSGTSFSAEGLALHISQSFEAAL